VNVDGSLEPLSRPLPRTPKRGPPVAAFARRASRCRGAGRCGGGLLTRSQANAPNGELADLFLETEVIGTGLGRALWEHAVASARSAGFTP
jgi:GNAT superfamily N-acetyltransferase